MRVGILMHGDRTKKMRFQYFVSTIACNSRNSAVFITNNRHNCTIEIDGDIYRLIDSNSTMRGLKFDKTYFDIFTTFEELQELYPTKIGTFEREKEEPYCELIHEDEEVLHYQLNEYYNNMEKIKY